MEHLEFVDKLNQLGCSFRSTNVEGKVKTIEIPKTYGKYSWHSVIKPENYETFKDSIQEKVIKRAEEIDFLMTVYFQVQYEISNRNANGLD